MFTDQQQSRLVFPAKVRVSEMPFGSWNRSTERNRDREHLEFRRSERKQSGPAMRQIK